MKIPLKSHHQLNLQHREAAAVGAAAAEGNEGKDSEFLSKDPARPFFRDSRIG